MGCGASRQTDPVEAPTPRNSTDGDVTVSDNVCDTTMRKEEPGTKPNNTTTNEIIKNKRSKQKQLLRKTCPNKPVEEQEIEDRIESELTAKPPILVVQELPNLPITGDSLNLEQGDGVLNEILQPRLSSLENTLHKSSLSELREEEHRKISYQHCETNRNNTYMEDTDEEVDNEHLDSTNAFGTTLEIGQQCLEPDRNSSNSNPVSIQPEQSLPASVVIPRCEELHNLCSPHVLTDDTIFKQESIGNENIILTFADCNETADRV